MHYSQQRTPHLAVLYDSVNHILMPLGYLPKGLLIQWITIDSHLAGAYELVGNSAQCAHHHDDGLLLSLNDSLDT